MKQLFGIMLAIISWQIQAQSLYSAAGAQCGEHGSGGCLHYRTPCPPEFDATIHFVLRTDANGQETSWQLFDVTNNSVVQSGSNLAGSTTYDMLLCAYRDHCYQLTLNDAGGNGINPAQGGFSLAFNGEMVARGGVFQETIAVDLGACCSTLQVALSGGFACYDPATGQVAAATTGGVPPYTYDWSSGETHTSVQPVSPGQPPVFVTVTDAAGCTATAMIASTSIGPFSVVATTKTPSVKGASDGSATALVSGGIGPYRYVWSNGATTATADNLVAGQYDVTVYDAGGCSDATEAVVPEGPSGITTATSLLEGLALFPNPTYHWATLLFTSAETTQGLIQVFNAAGYAVYSQYVQAVVGENQQMLDLYGLPAGTYVVHVRVGEAIGSMRLVVMR